MTAAAGFKRLGIAIVGLVLAVADYVFARRKIMKTLRMTKQEVKDEYKSMEGDPHVRSQRRARQMELSRNRIRAEVMPVLEASDMP